MADRSITPYGRSWEYWHSLWIAWAVSSVGTLSWVSFGYAGFRAGNRRWLVWAAAYALIMVPLTVGIDDTVMGFLLLFVWLGSSAHALAIRREYLTRIAEKRIARRGGPTQAAPSSAATRLRPVNQAPADWYPNPAGGPAQQWWNGEEWTAHTREAPPSGSTIYSPSVTPSGSSATPTTSLSQGEARQLLDLNTAQEPELAGLPGVGAVLAKRIVAERHQRGGFQSVDELADAIGLKPHVLQRVRGNLTVGQRPEAPADRPRGRVVDF